MDVIAVKVETERLSIAEKLSVVLEKKGEYPNGWSSCTKPARHLQLRVPQMMMVRAMMLDIVDIGGGPAGYVSANEAKLRFMVSLLHLKSNLVEHAPNRGCIPTKTYLHNAEIIENIGAANRGIVIRKSYFIHLTWTSTNKI